MHCRKAGEVFALSPSFSRGDPLPSLDHSSFPVKRTATWVMGQDQVHNL